MGDLYSDLQQKSLRENSIQSPEKKAFSILRSKSYIGRQHSCIGTME